jgi:membrane-bound serine protease (ClpP class)
MKKIISLILMLISFTLWQSAFAGAAVQLEINGPIGPATQEYISKGIIHAENAEADLVILRIDTPGGLGTSMRNIIKVMLASDIPVVAFVGPSGARAASAGTFILYAANIAAMAPGTNIGAATPVNMLSSDKKAKTKMSASEKKVLNDSLAYIRSLAQLRDRNAKWAELAVQEGHSLSATEALQHKVINVIAPNVESLLDKINGMQVQVGDKTVTLHTKDMGIYHYQPDWRANLLAVITNPTIAYIFLMIAFYGIFLEFSHPGLIVPAIIGVIALLLGLYGLQMLPVNYVGLALIFLGFVLFIAEIFVTSFGILGISGLVSFVIGSILLMDTNVVGFGIPWGAILGFSIATAVFVFFLIQLVVRSQHRPKVSGLSTLIGQEGEIILDGNKTWLQVNGELWKVINKESFKPGDRAEVSEIDGLNITVKKL